MSSDATSHHRGVPESRGAGWRRLSFARSALAFRSALILIGLFKLLLVSKQDIVAFDRPHDDYWQILSSSHWYWGAPYDQWTLMHLPVYPLFVALTRLTGLPLRLAIELVYLGGA